MPRILPLFAVIAAMVPSMAAGQTRMIGFRGDGSGVFPDDCQPVAEWSETRNIVWKTPLPNGGNSSPIVVGRRAFVVCEPGWRSDCPVLVCVDADTGRILWQREVDGFAMLGAEQRKVAQALRARFFEHERKKNRLTWELRRDDEAVVARAKAEVAADPDLVIKEGKKGKPEVDLSRDAGHYRKRLVKEFHYLEKTSGPTWGLCTIGRAFPTPVSDGKRVYVLTGSNTVACYDLEGNQVWIRRFEEELKYHDTARFVVSPILADGKLIIHANAWARAMDMDTGKLVWQTPTEHQLYMEGQPSLMRLGDEKSPLLAVALSSGEVLRVSDGQNLTGRIGCFAGGAPFVTDGRNTIFGYNGRSGGHYHPDKQKDRFFAAEYEGHWIAVRLNLVSPDKVEPELLWSARTRDFRGEDAPLYHDGKLWKGEGVLDASTGELLQRSRLRAKPDHAWILAGGQLMGIDHMGKIAVIGAEELKPARVNELDPVQPQLSDEKRAQMVAMSGGDAAGTWYSWSFGRSTPFVSGNRIFVRSFDYLYCIGEKDKPFAPSKAFAAE